MKKKKIQNFWLLRAQEILGLLFISYALFQTVALFSYHPLDPSFNVAIDDVIANKAGVYGAYSAGFLLEYFGYASYIIIIYSLIFSVFFIKKLFPKFVLIRICAFLCAILSASLVLGFFNNYNDMEFVSYGGITGAYLKSQIESYIIFPLSFFLVLILSALLFSFAAARNLPKDCAFLYKVFSILAKSLYKTAKRLLFYVKKSSHYCHFIISKKFFKKRIKDIDASYDMPEATHAKIEKENIPPVNQMAPSYELPNLVLLKDTQSRKNVVNKSKLGNSANILQQTLEDFGVNGRILDVRPGPVVTLYEFEPSPGIKSSRIIGLADDVARSMSAVSSRIAIVPEKNALGIELPNETREIVSFKELLDSKEYQGNELNIPLALGKNIGGKPILADLSRMPHLLVAGTTGSGKSVAINTMILSILYKLSPSECKFIMIDPKMLELSIYEGIPHLLTPVVTDPKNAVQALRWAVQEMENRYRLMSSLGVRNIAGYNETIKKALKQNKVLTRTIQTGFDETNGKPIYEKVELDMQTLPFIVVIVDEMADLMLVAGKEIEGYIQRLAQMARAAGIHLIIATQRPSVDVITGVIKANFPTRISFQVTSKIDSRTILGEQGAEQLLGMGDMLYMYGGTKINRVHGAFVSDQEVADVVSYLKNQADPAYISDIFNSSDNNSDYASNGSNAGDGDGLDELYHKAVEIVLRDKKVSTSYVQRQLRIGYNRAANIIEEMESQGVISPPSSAGKREILAEN